MSRYRIEESAISQIEDIYIYTTDTWGEAQAETYLNGLYAMLDDIASGMVQGRKVPPILPIDGFVSRYRHHFVYWRRLTDGNIGVVAVLHERMHQSDRLRKLFVGQN